MNKILKPVLVVTTLLFAAVCTVFAVALFWIQSDAGLSWIRTQIDRRIAGRLAIENVRLSPLTQRLVLSDVVLYDDKEAPFAGFSRLSVRLDGWALLRREIRLTSVALADPWADLVVDEEGALNIAGALASPSGKAKPASADQAPGPSFNLVLENGESTGGRFTYDDKAGNTRVELTGVTLMATGNLLDRTGNLSVAIAHAGFENEAVHLKPTRIGLEAHLDGELATISDLTVTSEQLSAHLSGTAQDLTAIPVLDGRLTMETSLSQAKEVFGLGGAYDGAVSVALTVKGRSDDPAADLALRFDGGTIASQMLDKGSLACTLTHRRININEATVELGRGQAGMTGGIDLTRVFPSGFFNSPENVNAIAYDLILTSSIPDLSPWLERFATIGGTFSGKIQIVGVGFDPSEMNTRMNASISGQNLSAPGMERPVKGQMELSARASHGNIVLSGLDLSADGLHLTGDGRFQTQRREVSGKMALTATDLHRILAIVGRRDIRGSCDANLKVEVSLQASDLLSSLTGKLSLVAGGLAIDAATIGDLSAQMTVKEGSLLVDRLRLVNQDSVLTASGRAQIIDPETARWTANPTFDFDFQSDHMNPGHFVDGIDGNVTLQGNVQGTIDDPTGKLRLSGKSLDLAGQPLQDLFMEMSLARRRLNLDNLILSVAPDQQLTAVGWIDLEKVIDLTVRSNGIATSAIESLKTRFPGAAILNINAVARGPLENPDINGQLTVTDLIYNNQPMADLRLSTQLHDKKIHVEGKMDFSVTADCDLENMDFDARLAFNGTETAPYFEAVGKPEIHGKLTGQVAATGNLRDLPHLSAKVELDDLRLFFKDAPLVSSDRITVRMADRKLSIVDLDLALLNTGNLHLEGEAQWNGSQSDGLVDIAIDGRIPVSVTGTMTDQLADATGTLIMAGKISGRTEQPRIDATLDLEKVGMTVPGLHQKLHDLNGRIHLTDNRLDVDSLSGMLDTGRFTVSGGLSHKYFTPMDVDLQVSANAIPLEVPDTLSLLLNGNIRLTGRNRSAEAKGNIVLLEGVYYKDVKISLLQIASSTTAVRRTVAPASEPVSIPYFDTVRLNITISHRQPFVVDNNLAQLEISPDLTIGGTLAQPLINGRAQIREGTVLFQKKTFDVKKGVIDFIDPYQTVADIDIQSETTIRDWTITLAIKGTPDNLKFSLSSVPSETESDILSLILFGKTTTELTQGEGGTKYTTSQIMAEMIADTFGDDIKRETGLDILQVETNGDKDEDQGSVKVTVGKHLSDRMTVKYAVTTKDGAVIRRAISEYKLLEHILVSGFQDSKGIYGSELVYRIEFR